MNQAIQEMLKVPGTHYVTDPSQLERGPNGEPAKQQVLPVYVSEDGTVCQLHQGNRLGAVIDPDVFREDAIVLRERPKHEPLQAVIDRAS